MARLVVAQEAEGDEVGRFRGLVSYSSLFLTERFFNEYSLNHVSLSTWVIYQLEMQTCIARQE